MSVGSRGIHPAWNQGTSALPQPWFDSESIRQGAAKRRHRQPIPTGQGCDFF
ncbi:MAG: hypothetical protein AB2705_22670 [Candidatus Thiodiazotropha sp.]